MSLISLERFLFSLLTSSSWRTASSYAGFTLNSSEEALRVSFWAESRSMPMLSTLLFHSPTILSNCLAFFSMARLRICAWSRAKSMKFVDGLMIHSGDPVNDYVDSACRHVLLRQGVLGIKVK